MGCTFVGKSLGAYGGYEIGFSHCSSYGREDGNLGGHSMGENSLGADGGA